MSNKMDERLLVNTAELQRILGGVCYRTAYRIGTEAKAKVMIGSKPRWKMSRIDAYLEEQCMKEAAV